MLYTLDLTLGGSDIHLGFRVHAFKILGITKNDKKHNFSPIRCGEDHTWGLIVPKPKSFRRRDLKTLQSFA